MIRRCRGNCGKVENRQPRKDARVIYFTCSDCAPKFVEAKVVYSHLKVLHFGRTVLHLPVLSDLTRG